MHRALVIGLVVAIGAIGAGVGYALGRSAGRDVQVRAYGIGSGPHWVTLSKAGCAPTPNPAWLGEAVCSWYGKLRVAP